MSGRRRRALVVAAVLAAAALVVVKVGPGLVAGAPVRATADREPARRWAVALDWWPSAVAGDRHGAVVVGGGAEARALDRDGAVQWQTPVPGVDINPPALDRRRVVVSARDRVVALDRGTGALRWQVDVPDGDAGPVARARDVVLFGTETGDLVAVGAADGIERWTLRHPGAVRSTLAVAGDVVAAAWHGGDTPMLRVVDVTTGALQWEAPLTRYATVPVVALGQVVIAEGDGHRRARVISRRLSDGAVQWATPVPASFESGITPGIAGDRVAVVDHFGTVSVLDRATGAVIAEVDLGVPVLHTTVVLTRTVAALTTYAGELVLVDPETGRIRSRGDPGGFPAGIARAGGDLLVALRLTDPGMVVAYRM